MLTFIQMKAIKLMPRWLRVSADGTKSLKSCKWYINMMHVISLKTFIRF